MTEHNVILSVADARAEAAERFLDNRSQHAVPFSKVPRLGFEGEGLLAFFGPYVDRMILSDGVLRLIPFVKLLAGAENMYLISGTGEAHSEQIRELIQHSPVLKTVFPVTRRFFWNNCSTTKAEWKLEICRTLHIDLMLDDNRNSCELLRNSDIRCFRSMWSDSEKDCTVSDNFETPDDAMRGLLRELLETRTRLGIPDHPFSVFGPGSQSVRRADLPEASSEALSHTGHQTTPQKPMLATSDSLEGWRLMPLLSSVDTTDRGQRRPITLAKRWATNPETPNCGALVVWKPTTSTGYVQSDDDQCKGRHMHQPSQKRRRLLLYPQWRHECRELAVKARCARCIALWNAESESPTLFAP
jgi:hypothetical protein